MARVNGSFATSEVPGTRFADVRWVAETGSTNRDLLAVAASGAAEGHVLVADHQTAGRGRLDRTWIAPPGASLLVSVLLRPVLPPEELFLLTLACGLAAGDAVAEVAGVQPGLKWPNDVVVVGGPLSDRKIGGILAESHVAEGRVDAVVVGMGLNLNWPAELPADIASTATAVNHVTGQPVDREQVLVEWLHRYEAYLVTIEHPDRRDEFMNVVRARSATIGREVRVEGAHETFEGLAVGIDEQGRLVVDRGGVTTTVAVGDVVHARLAD